MYLKESLAYDRAIRHFYWNKKKKFFSFVRSNEFKQSTTTTNAEGKFSIFFCNIVCLFVFSYIIWHREYFYDTFPELKIFFFPGKSFPRQICHLLLLLNLSSIVLSWFLLRCGIFFLSYIIIKDGFDLKVINQNVRCCCCLLRVLPRE